MTRPPPDRPFPRDLLAGDTLAAARALLGARLVREPDATATARRTGRIVEVEAYIGQEDRASHARMGPTPRNRPMFGPAGVAYVFLVYGIHHCLNVVTEADGRPGAVLIRAVEPLDGLDAMRAARSRAGVRDGRLAAGPGCLGAAFGVDLTFSGADLCEASGPLRLLAPVDGEPPPEVVAGPRIGIGYAGEPWTSRPWRLGVRGSPALSRPVG